MDSSTRESTDEHRSQTKGSARTLSVSSQIATMYERKDEIVKMSREGTRTLQMSSNLSRIIHESVEEEIFRRITSNLSLVNMMIDKAQQSLEHDDKNEVNPEQCIEFVFVFSQIGNACERFARLINSINRRLGLEYLALSSSSSCSFSSSPSVRSNSTKIPSSSSYDIRGKSPFKVIYDLMSATGRLLESIDCLSRTFGEDVEVQKALLLTSVERSEISEGFHSLGAMLGKTRKPSKQDAQKESIPFFD
jgi:hypothetical protein